MNSDLERRQLDRRFASLGEAQSWMLVQGNRVRSVREALHMSQAQLARRMGVTQPTVARIEKDEAEGRLTLRTLSRVAEALECHLYYALMPKARDLEHIVRHQAMKKARERVGGANQSMALEGQSVSEEEREALIAETASDILADKPTSIWDDDE
ncbi:mobile mystery protein A [bacterium]|nr:mobile mystery protein A [bacterium]